MGGSMESGSVRCEPGPLRSPCGTGSFIRSPTPRSTSVTLSSPAISGGHEARRPPSASARPLTLISTPAAATAPASALAPRSLAALGCDRCRALLTRNLVASVGAAALGVRRNCGKPHVEDMGGQLLQHTVLNP